MAQSNPQSYFLLMTLVLCSVTAASAQQQRIAYVDTDYILSQMSEYQGIQQQLSSQSTEWNNELEELEEEIEQLKQEFEEKEILYTEELQQQHQQEIDQRIEERQQFLEDKFGSEGEYYQLQQQLLEPIQRRVMEAVRGIAEREGFDFIFDRSQDTNMLYGESEWNLSDEVLQELGRTLNNPSN